MANDAHQIQSSLGSDDEIGTGNLMPPYPIKSAAGLAKKCKVSRLEVVLDSNVPAFPPSIHERDNSST